jgi:hypothetical protein
VPHPVGVDGVRAGGLRDLEHPAVDVRGHPGQHPVRRRAEPRRPVLAHQVVVAADAAGGDDDRLRAQVDVAHDDRELASPRAAELGSSSAPRTPTTAPPSTTSSSTRWRKRSSTSPRSTAARTRRSKGASSPGPVPQVMWKRGTELP